MIEGLDQALESTGQPGLMELRESLEDLLGGREAKGRLIGEQPLRSNAPRVFRLRFALTGHVRALVVKRLEPEIACRTELAAKRWLPAVGLSDSGPPLLARV